MQEQEAAIISGYTEDTMSNTRQEAKPDATSALEMYRRGLKHDIDFTVEGDEEEELREVFAAVSTSTSRANTRTWLKLRWSAGLQRPVLAVASRLLKEPEVDPMQLPPGT